MSSRLAQLDQYNYILFSLWMSSPPRMVSLAPCDCSVGDIVDDLKPQDPLLRSPQLNNSAPAPRTLPRLEQFLLEFHRAKPEDRVQARAACHLCVGTELWVVSIRKLNAWSLLSAPLHKLYWDLGQLHWAAATEMQVQSKKHQVINIKYPMLEILCTLTFCVQSSWGGVVPTLGIATSIFIWHFIVPSMLFIHPFDNYVPI